jgi:predicted DCC family thiol-disulfide oxidoreductase YuxK
MNEPPVGSCIVLYDGVCALCNGAITFILQRERRQDLLYASLQGDFAIRFLSANQRDPANLDTLYVIRDYGTSKQRLLERSDAVVHIARQLRSAWTLFSLLGVLPKNLRDWLYDRVARNRYRLFGKHDQCVMPKPQWKARFID